MSILRAFQGSQNKTSRASLIGRLRLEVSSDSLGVGTPLLEKQLPKNIHWPRLDKYDGTLQGHTIDHEFVLLDMHKYILQVERARCTESTHLGGEEDEFARWLHVLANQERRIALGAAGLFDLNRGLAGNLGQRPDRTVEGQDALGLREVVRERVGVVAQAPGALGVAAAYQYEGS